MDEIVRVLVVTALPITELRGGIPLGITLGLDPLFTFIIATVTNALIFFPVFFALCLFYDRLFSRVPLFNRYLSGLRKRGKPVVDKYGFWGLFLFVAVPLPFTGAYSGTILAWLLGMNWKKAFLAVGLGVVVAGVIVMMVTLGIFNIS